MFSATLIRPCCVDYHDVFHPHRVLAQPLSIDGSNEMLEKMADSCLVVTSGVLPMSTLIVVTSLFVRYEHASGTVQNEHMDAFRDRYFMLNLS